MQNHKATGQKKMWMHLMIELKKLITPPIPLTTVNTKVNKGRDEALNNWNEAEKSFTDSHMPYYK